jgi:hypothetical protein
MPMARRAWGGNVATETAALQVGDRVELIKDFPQRRPLRQGRQGVVLLAGAGAPWGMVSVQFGSREGSELYQLHPRHLRLIARAPRDLDQGRVAGSDAPDQAPPDVVSTVRRGVPHARKEVRP